MKNLYLAIIKQNSIEFKLASEIDKLTLGLLRKYINENNYELKFIFK